MKLVNGLKLAAFVCVLLLAAQPLWAQRAAITIHATDGVGLDSVTIGTDPAATGQIDTSLGERELPPQPPTFDFRSVSLNGYDTLGQGSSLNLHHLVYDTQTDHYKLAFRSDDAGGDVHFSWAAGLGSVGAGYWHLIGVDPNTFLPFDIDMTAQTTFYIPGSASTLTQNVTIIKGDAKSFRTAIYGDLASAVDSKSKQGGVEKAKPYASYACFTFTVPVDSPAQTELHIVFKENITSITPAAATGTKNIDYVGLSPIAPGGSIQVCAYGDKGKELLISKYHWGTNTKAKPVPPLPNYNNVWAELYAQSAFPAIGPDAKPAGMYLGLLTQVGQTVKLKPIFRYITHPKYGDAIKTLNGGGKSIFHTGLPGCLYETDKPKDVIKGLKTATAAKYNNLLIAELATLKFNIAMNQLKVVGGAGFDQMLYRAQGGDPASYDGLTVAAIALKADSALSCAYDSLPPHNHFDFTSLLAVIENINAAFNAPFDTTSFGVKTRPTPVKALAQQNVLYRTSLSGNYGSNVDNFVRGNETPLAYKLEQNYPNPFNPTTTIQFSLPEDAMITLKVYNILGQEVATLADHQQFESGTNEVTFDASRLATGVYYYRILVNDGANFQQVKKMMLIK